jgi:hypothetical protein
LIDDIITIDSVTVESVAAVSGTDFDPYPYNSGPKYQLKGIDGYTFTSGQKNVVIVGNWGYATSIPDIVNQVTLERATRYYQQKGQDLMLSEKMGDYEYERFSVVAAERHYHAPG